MKQKLQTTILIGLTCLMSCQKMEKSSQVLDVATSSTNFKLFK